LLYHQIHPNDIAETLELFIVEIGRLRPEVVAAKDAAWLGNFESATHNLVRLGPLAKRRDHKPEGVVGTESRFDATLQKSAAARRGPAFAGTALRD